MGWVSKVEFNSEMSLVTEVKQSPIMINRNNNRQNSPNKQKQKQLVSALIVPWNEPWYHRLFLIITFIKYDFVHVSTSFSQMSQRLFSKSVAAAVCVNVSLLRESY